MNDLVHNPVLIADFGIELKMPSGIDAPRMSVLYNEACERGDFFAGRYDDPDSQIFNPDWLRHDYENPDHLWFIFTDREGTLLGSTGFFHDNDSGTGALFTSDETQIRPIGRGKRIMDSFLKRIVPNIERSGAGLSTNFVLTPESKGLRRSLQPDLGMIALGIHPHILHHPKTGITRSEISAAKYLNLTPKPLIILPDFERLYSIVRQQIPSLQKPDIVRAQIEPEVSRFADRYLGTEQAVDAADPTSQSEALNAGFLPVVYSPDSNSFRMARFPQVLPELGFVLDNEHIEPNKLLVAYLNKVLYGEVTKVGRGQQ